MKKFITTILAIVFLLTGCNGMTENNSSNDISNDISSEESVESVGSVESSESSESSDTSFESSEVSDSSEESSESVSSETSSEESSSEESSEDISSEESREENISSAPVTPPVGNDNGNESKPEDDVSSSTPVESEPEKDESKVEDVSSAPDVSEPDVPVVHVHSYTAKVKTATCTAEGYTEYTCECGDSYKADIVEALGHDWNEWEVVQKPTTTSEGIKLRGCYRCFKGEEASIPKIVVTITQADLDMMAEEALDELNDYRRANGLQPLVTGPIAHQIASERAVQLATDFSHNGATAVLHKYMYNPNDPASSPKVGGENIARDKRGGSEGVYTENIKVELAGEARAAIRGFQPSPGHWGDLMSSSYTACGIGFYIDMTDPTERTLYICVLTLDKLYGADAQQ